MSWLEDLRKRFKEPTDVPPWMGTHGVILSSIGFVFLAIAIYYNEPSVFGISGLLLSAGGYSWGLADGWDRALKATP